MSLAGHRQDMPNKIETKKSVKSQVFIICFSQFRTRVHLLVHEPEGEGLVPHESLVVGLGVGDALLHPTTVGESVDDVANVPIFILRREINKQNINEMKITNIPGKMFFGNMFFVTFFSLMSLIHMSGMAIASR